MNVLTIGNSFSEDATRYLHRIARADKTHLYVVNLFIGNCSLSTHYRNMLSEKQAYRLEVNGEISTFSVSIKEALLSCDWDIVSFQQASLNSTDFETYEPYLSELSAYVKKYAPKAKQIIHQTWAYEQGCERYSSILPYNDQYDMYCDLKDAYEKAAKSIDAYMIIESGKVLQKLLKAGIKIVHRDKYHVSYGIGRYAIGLLWYAMLTGNDVTNNSFCDFDEEITENEVEIIKNCVKEVVAEYKLEL